MPEAERRAPGVYALKPRLAMAEPADRQVRPTGAHQAPLMPPEQPSPQPSFRQAVLEAITAAHGEPLHAAQILQAARAAGGNTLAKDPINVTDLVAGNWVKAKAPVARVAPRVYRWTDEQAGS